MAPGAVVACAVVSACTFEVCAVLGAAAAVVVGPSRMLSVPPSTGSCGQRCPLPSAHVPEVVVVDAVDDSATVAMTVGA